jgi:hypothetical protein
VARELTILGGAFRMTGAQRDRAWYLFSGGLLGTPAKVTLIAGRKAVLVDPQGRAWTIDVLGNIIEQKAIDAPSGT